MLDGDALTDMVDVTAASSGWRGPPVLIIGAGPVGMVLAIELARVGVACVLVDADLTSRLYPKGNTHNARTMEHYRRLGLADQVRAVGLPAKHPTDVAYFTRVTTYELARLRMPSTAEKLRVSQEAGDFEQVIEPIHRANQMYVEEVLAQRCAATPLIHLYRGWLAVGFSQDADGVAVELRRVGNGDTVMLRGQYLIGCDGGRSMVRQGLGIQYAGDGPLGRSIFGGPMVSAHLRIPALGHLLAGREFWQGWTVNPDLRTDLIALNGQDEYMTHAMMDVPTDSERMASIVRRALGRDLDVEVLALAAWTSGRALVAERFAVGRVFLCGDAVHLFTPTGGFGMNTGIDDAANLAWKLAATLHGWGGPDLLESYEFERRPVAVRNTMAARQLASNVQSVEVSADIEDPGGIGQAERERVGKVLGNFGEEFASIGIQLGARYDGSPIVLPDGTPPPHDRSDVYTPTGCPGGRLPHLRLPDGSSLFDRLGTGFTLLRMGASADVDSLKSQALARRIPLTVIDVDHPGARDFYEASLVLVRPDQYVAWRGDRLDDPRQLLDVVTAAAGPAGST